MSGKDFDLEIVFAQSAVKQFQQLDQQIQKRIKAGILGLKRFPPEGDIAKLKGRAGQFRLRVGGWRIIYQYRFEALTVEILGIFPRGQAYKK